MSDQSAQVVGSVAGETRKERDARMAWWREAKFGMFIHWGVYAAVTGNDKGYRGGEWIMAASKIPVEEYRSYARSFTAENYDPDAWVDLAVRAGMRYIIITAKHHDGFALFPSDVTDWDVAGATTHGKDLIAPLANAARKRGLKFGLYYSHAQDWVHRGGAKFELEFKEGDGWDESHKGSFDEYLQSIAVPQVREILTRYQPDVLWYDTPCYMTAERAKPFLPLVSLRPGLIVNDRLGGDCHGDTETPENIIPPAPYPDGRDWETCMVMNDNWGYVPDDHDWKSFEQLICCLVDVVSKGGNYLLNVGPDPTGIIPRESVDLLTRIGAWMDTNGESIRGCTASPFPGRLAWGRCTVKPDGADTFLFLHLMNIPASRRILLPGLHNKVLSARWLDREGSLQVEDTSKGPVVLLSPDCSSVIKLRIKGSPEVVRTPIMTDEDGVFRLTAMDARLKGEFKADQTGGLDRIGGWKKPGDLAEWDIEAENEGTYRLALKATTPEKAGTLLVSVAAVNHVVNVEPTTNWRHDYREYTLDRLCLKEGQRFQVRISTDSENPKNIYVNSVELIPENR